MKKTFLSRRNALLSSTSISWGSVALLFAVLILVVRLVAPNLFLNMFTPVLRASGSIALQTHTFMSGFRDVALLAERNEQLVNENASLAHENFTLRKQIDDSGGSTTGVISAVVARPPVSAYDTLILAQGTNKNIRSGMGAFSAGVPIGVVSAVTAEYSRVTLFSSPTMRTQGWVGESNIAIDITGTGSGTLYAMISRSAEVRVGDLVSIIGPGMLPLGSVVRIDDEPSDPGVVLRIKPTINFFSIGWVELRDIGVLGEAMFATTTIRL